MVARGSARVTKNIVYDIQHREVSGAYGSVTRLGTSTNRTITGLTNGTFYEARIRGVAVRSDATNTEVEGPWSTESNQEKPVKDTVTLTYGVANTRTGAITAPRTLELTPNSGSEIQITNPQNPVVLGQFYALDIDRGDEYARNFNIVTLETRPLPTDITAGSNYVVEADVNTGERRYSIGPAGDNSSIQRWFIEVN